MHLSLRFDFRNPAFADTDMADRYAAALEMAEWAESLGVPVSIGVSEHHGSADGYLPSPSVMLGAFAARTKHARLSVAALIAPFHDPLRIAEDFCVLDNLSKGRVDMIVAGGYAPSEFAMFGIELKERPRRVTEVVNTLKAAFAGEEFEYRGRTVRITPPPYRPGGPRVIMGGASEPAARRAARIADGFVPSVPGVWDFYRDEMVNLGKPDPGQGMIGRGEVIALATDHDVGWADMGPYFLHETNAYGAWKIEAGEDTPYDTFADVEDLRASNRYYIVTPDEMITNLQAAPIPVAQFHPLCGGMPIQTAWTSLKLFENEVLPAFRSAGEA